jgi:hypothetical protein
MSKKQGPCAIWIQKAPPVRPCAVGKISRPCAVVEGKRGQLESDPENSGRPERGKTNIGTYLYLYEDLISEYIYICIGGEKYIKKLL